MKASLSSFDLRALVAEWQGLVGGHIDKVYQREDEVILRINLAGGGRIELYSKSGAWLSLHQVEDKPDTPPAFAQALRRILDNARILAVEQRGFDRISVFTVEKGGETLRLIFELFGRGNLVVVRGDTTVACLHPQRYRDRSVQPGEPYGFPPSGIDPLELDRDGFRRAIREAKGQVVRVLASVMNLGGQYSEELCLRANVDKDTKVKEIPDASIDALYTALNNVVVAIDEERHPAVVRKDGKAIDAIPIELVQHANLEREEFPTFNEAVSRYLDVMEPEALAADATSAKLDRRVAQQEESLKALREEAIRLEAQALFLYGHFSLFDELVRALREGRDPPDPGQIKSVDRRTHTVTIAIGDFDAIVLEYEKDVTQNAQALYDRRREAQLKAQRVEESIDATHGAIKSTKAKAVKAGKKTKIKGTKAMWFDAYRWCFSSEGFLILGGRDARTNDQLVKKHLKDGDRYAHADLHGAPSVVIKEGSKATEVTLREACEFALAYSKAWSAGLAGGSAYWVLPEQVSKQAESGEFLPRGAFVIRGKRNYIHDLPVRIAIGETEVEGHRKITGGPESAIAARSNKYAVLTPGKEDRERIAKRLAEIFEIPIEEVVRGLPSGGVTVSRAEGLSI
jgi:predicted ribosome quality control (RQC) complex YloA/Tae2 family protein